MGKIDTSNWKEFRVGDLFDVKCSPSVDMTTLNLDADADYEYISRTSLNNGVYGRVSYLGFEPNSKGTFSVTQIGEKVCQYRENAWYATQNIFILTPKYLELRKVPYFIVTVFNEMLSRIYTGEAYSSYPTLKSLPNNVVFLPTTPSGQPDWDYMEQYMRNIMTECEAKYDSLVATVKDEHPIDVSGWGEFRVGDLFDIETGGDLILYKYEDGDIPVISHSAENNGIQKRVNIIENRPLYDCSKTLSLADRGNFKCFVQDENFYIGTRVKALILNRYTVSKLCLLYLSVMIDRLAIKFSYKDNATGNLGKHSIKLPIDANGEPDWLYMENYMRNIMDGCTDMTDALAGLLGGCN